MARKTSAQQTSDSPASQEPVGIPISRKESLLTAETDASSGALISQQEIDALVSTYELVNSRSLRPASPSRSVRMYDFASPDRFSREQFRALHGVHTVFVEGLSSVLSDMLRSQVTANLAGMEQTTYREYLASIPSTTLMAEISAQPLSRRVIFEFSPLLAGAWIDCLCGGDPDAVSAPADLTPIDLAIAERIVGRCARIYSDAWAGIATVIPELTRVLSSEHYEDSLLPSDAVLICTVEIAAGRNYGIATVCVPAADVEAVLRPISVTGGGPSRTDKKADGATARRVERVLDPVRVPCRVILGDASLTLSDLVHLRVGDIIRTSRRACEDLEVRVGDRHLFDCRPGTQGAGLGVVISRTVDSEALADLDAAPAAHAPAQP